MNIMEIISGTRVNGAILHCLLLSRELARRGHRVTLVCLANAWIAGQAAGRKGSKSSLPTCTAGRSTSCGAWPQWSASGRST